MRYARLISGLLAISVLVACGSDKADIAKVSEVTSNFGEEYKVTEVGPTGIDPTMLEQHSLPKTITFEPSQCADVVAQDLLPDGIEGNMAAVFAEGRGNRFVVMAVHTNQPIPVSEYRTDCAKIAFHGELYGKAIRGMVEAVEAPTIDGAHTLGVHRIVQTTGDHSYRTGEIYTYSAHFGPYQIIVTANPLVLPDKPLEPVDTAQAQALLSAGVAAIRG